MEYTVTIKVETKQTSYVSVNGLCVAVGPEKMCKALVRELRTFKDRAKLVYDLELIEPQNMANFDSNLIDVYG
jgi:hypothetical protein